MEGDSFRSGLGGSGGQDTSIQQSYHTNRENQHESQFQTEPHATPGSSFFETQTVAPWFAPAVDDGDGTNLPIQNSYNATYGKRDEFQLPGKPHAQPETSFLETETVASPFTSFIDDSNLATSTQQSHSPNGGILGGFQPPSRSYAQPQFSFLETETIGSGYSPRVFTPQHPSEQTALTYASTLHSAIHSHEEYDDGIYNTFLNTDDFHPSGTLEQPKPTGPTQTSSTQATLQGNHSQEVNPLLLGLEDPIGNFPGVDYPRQDVEAFFSVFRRFGRIPEPWQITPLGWLTRMTGEDVKAWFEQHRDDPLPSAELNYPEESRSDSGGAVNVMKCPGRSGKGCKKTGKHVCPLCGATFTKKQDLKRHLEAENPPKWWCCPYCDGIKLARRDKLKRHLRKLHPSNSFGSIEHFAVPNKQIFPETCGDCNRKSRTWLEWFNHLYILEHKNAVDTIMLESSPGSSVGDSSTESSRSSRPIDNFALDNDHFEEFRATGMPIDQATRRDSLQKAVNRWVSRGRRFSKHLRRAYPQTSGA